MSFEQGPIRPPSEARSLLVRVSRNCPWNRCAFCPVYKGQRFSLRSADDVLADLDAMKAQLGDRYRSAFLQDANPLASKPDELVRIIEGLRQRFPSVERVTAYARSDTLARRKLVDLRRLRTAGLDRVHVGLESGCDAVLSQVNKGVTRERQIAAGQRAVQAGFELSLYFMPGLGGVEFSDAHADDTASAVAAIGPHFVRLRSTVAMPGTELHALQQEGSWGPLSEEASVAEIRRFLAGLEGVETRLESDHVLNLLMELRGDLPQDLAVLIDTCDDFLGRPERWRQRFVLARRLGWSVSMRHYQLLEAEGDAEQALQQLEAQSKDLESVFRQLKMRTI